MTRTEERLADALDAVAQSVLEEDLPPLPAHGPAHRPRPARRWARWLAPVAAAASVTLIVVLASAVHLLTGRPHGGDAGTAGPPRYYATLETGGIVIRATATGAVTGRIPNERPGHGGFGRYATGVAATGGGTEFVVAYSGTLSSHGNRTWLYSFHLTSSGRVTGFALVRGGVFNGLLAANDIVVSPDGSKVALTLYPLLIPSQGTKPAEIGVVDSRTGKHALWTGGLHRSGLDLKIPSISWAAGGRSLVFLAVWCRGAVYGSQYCTAGRHDAQVRRLGLAAGGGSLSQGRGLFGDSARYPDIIQALLSPDGKSITMVVLTGRAVGTVNPVPPGLRVIQVPLAGGQPRLLYRGAVDGYPDVFLSADASGRYLLLAWARNGWIDHGRLHALAPQGAAITDAW